MNMYLSSLQAMEYLLNKVGERRWRDWIRTDIECWNERKSIRHHLQAYGGMGSFNDVVICRSNGPQVDKTLEPWVDVLFNWLKSLCFNLAKNPMEIITADELKKRVGYYDAPLSAFVGGENAAIEHRGMIEHDHNLEGWRCLNCGFSEIDQNAINYYIARLILPNLLFEACVQNNLISIIDDVFECYIPGKQDMDFLIKKLIKISSINFIQERDGWMSPCPSCLSDNTALYRWIVKSDKIIPASNNLPLKKKK